LGIMTGRSWSLPLGLAAVAWSLGTGCQSDLPGGQPPAGQLDAGQLSACAERAPALAWSVHPPVARLSGTVTARSFGTGGLETLTVVEEATSREHVLALGPPLSGNIETGEAITVTTAEESVFYSYRTLQIAKDGVTIVYATAIEQPDLPAPLRLEVGEVECAASAHGDVVKHHRLVAYSGDIAFPIGVGGHADVYPYRVYNDLVQRYTAPVEDAVDTFHVAAVRIR
jgi:hypothetical protein